nr:hypothetical protein [Tanacetum cinerariifolium]
MQKNLALITKYFKKIYKPTNNNLRTSSNSKNKNVDTTPWYKNDDHSGQFGNQRTVNVVGAREKVGSMVVQQSGIQCFNCREFRHFATECRKPKRVKDSAYHKEKMLLSKQAEQGIGSTLQLHGKDPGVEMDYSNVIPDSLDMCEDDIQNDQNDVESDDEQWSRFVMIVKQQHKLDEVSYHKLFDILKQYQNEVNELHAERLAWNANPLALANNSYVLYDCVMTPLATQLEQKPRKDHGTRKGRHSTISSTFNEPSSSHLNNDDYDGNNEGTLCASTPSPIRYVNSLTNEVLQVFQNQHNINPYLEPFYTRQTKIINRQVQIRDEHRGGLRSIKKGLRNLWRNIKK